MAAIRLAPPRTPPPQDPARPQTAGRTWELDQPALVALKEELLAAVGQPACERRVVAVDLLGDGWPDALRDAGFRPDVPSAWLMEGLLYYLEPAESEGVLRQVSAAAATGSRLGADFVTEDFLTSPLMQAHVARMAARGTPLRFGTNRPDDLLRSYGWGDVVMTQPGEPGAGEDRWPWPVVSAPIAPRCPPQLPRHGRPALNMPAGCRSTGCGCGAT